MKSHRLINIRWPEFGPADTIGRPSRDELLSRLSRARDRMRSLGYTHLVVYGDREHFANITYLSGYDPRYEEAVLIVSLEETPLLVVGNEGEGYLNISTLYESGELRAERFQSFSLLDQPRGDSRGIEEIFRSEGIDRGSRVGCAGWKYFAEFSDGSSLLEIPSYISDTLRDLAGRDMVLNASEIFMSPKDGLRSVCSPYEIAFFEYTNCLASDAMKRMIFALEEGKTDFEVAREVEYPGLPFACHMTFVTANNRDRGLSSPEGNVIRRGEPFASNISYWGSNICRAGWIAGSAQDLPDGAGDYVQAFAGPYVEAMGEWFELMKVGTSGGSVSRLIAEKLPFEDFGIYLNPGHLIHLDEWVSSAIYPDSDIPLQSGNALQVDIIPTSERYFSTRMEDGIVIADVELRNSIQGAFPKTYARCVERRRFMIEVLGFDVPEDVLPLSNIAGIVPPFLLDPETVIGLA